MRRFQSKAAVAAVALRVIESRYKRRTTKTKTTTATREEKKRKGGGSRAAVGRGTESTRQQTISDGHRRVARVELS